jgi:predicted kinase
VSEYQYYEFQAIDRPLSEEDMRWLRGLSTRAQITTTSFTNVYHWGDFRGDPIKLMERCFAHARQYCHRYGASLLMKRGCVLIDLHRDEEPGEWDGWENGSAWMASLARLRDDLLDGDWRCLYLAWLLGIETESLSDSAKEPPVPPGLKELSAPLRAFVDFLDIDAELIEVAAERSGPRAAEEPSVGELKNWIRSLAASEKDEWLLRIAEGDEQYARRSLLRCLREAADRNALPSDDDHTPGRTVADIWAVWQQRLEATHRRLAEEAAKERQRRAKAEAQARKKHLENIASRAPAIWKEVSAWIAKRSPKGYDQAVKLLIDLKDAAALANRGEEFDRRLDDLRSCHGGKPSFMRRLRDAELVG